MRDSIETTTREYAGRTITIDWFCDTNCEAPWEHEDGHGTVSDWTRRGKRPGEVVLHEDRGSYRYYDWAEAIKIAKRDGWDAPPYKTGTKGQQADRAVKADFELLEGWCNDDWCWVGYSARIEGMDWEDSLWGIDSPSMAQFEEEVFQSAVAYMNKEATEGQWAIDHEIATV